MKARDFSAAFSAILAPSGTDPDYDEVRVSTNGLALPKPGCLPQPGAEVRLGSVADVVARRPLVR
jgi:hypothetical protein